VTTDPYMSIPVSEFEALHDRLRELQAKETEGIDHAVYEMVCEERDVLEARLAKADKLAEILRKTIHRTPGWTGPDVWWADEARAALDVWEGK